MAGKARKKSASSKKKASSRKKAAPKKSVASRRKARPRKTGAYKEPPVELEVTLDGETRVVTLGRSAIAPTNLEFGTTPVTVRCR